MNDGKQFESSFRESVPKDCYYLRIRDPVQSFSNTARFSLQNAYDCQIFKSPNLFCLELKSTKSTSLSFWKDGDDSKATPNIKKNQILGLSEASKHHGIISGLITNWRSTNRTYFIPISAFISFAESTTKKSINEGDILSLPHVLVEQTLKRTRYSYNISRLIEDCVKQFSF